MHPRKTRPNYCIQVWPSIIDMGNKDRFDIVTSPFPRGSVEIEGDRATFRLWRELSGYGANLARRVSPVKPVVPATKPAATDDGAAG